ncbi:hypothetical protein C8J56DRAFT_1057132 [Mycena floridula]|nr:hypothetical protein C8J56DRAFT_1057132 [Mycena floridula]
MYYTDGQDDPKQMWQTVLKTDGIQPALLDLISASSHLTDFSIRRHGLFIDWRASRSCLGWDHSLLPYLRAQVPLYLFWGTLNSPLITTTSDMLLHRVNFKLMTSDRIREAAIQAFESDVKQPTGTEDSPSLWAIESAESDSSLPSVFQKWTDVYDTGPPHPSHWKEKNGRVTWQEFFCQRQAEEQRMRAIENDDSHMIRTERETSASLFATPGLGGSSAKTFLWVVEGDSRIRRLVPKQEVDAIWATYTSSQKRFSPFHNVGR